MCATSHDNHIFRSTETSLNISTWIYKTALPEPSLPNSNSQCFPLSRQCPWVFCFLKNETFNGKFLLEVQVFDFHSLSAAITLISVPACKWALCCGCSGAGAPTEGSPAEMRALMSHFSQEIPALSQEPSSGDAPWSRDAHEFPRLSS